MTARALLGALLIFSLSAGCNATVDSAQNALVTDQTRFDFSIRADREMFVEDGLEFTGSVGPYAVFHVTGDDPRLVGPRVTHDRVNDGLVMLCGASNYFAPSGSDADDARLTFKGGPIGEDELTGSTTQALRFEDCSEADDNFQARPDEPELMEAELFLTDGERVVLDWANAPEIGSQVLIRIASLSEPERDHNDSPTIPVVCCDGDFCALQ